LQQEEHQQERKYVNGRIIVTRESVKKKEKLSEKKVLAF